MKKLFLLLLLSILTLGARAMSFEEAQRHALFLSDKMAYELGLTARQYEEVYQINLDYLLFVEPAQCHYKSGDCVVVVDGLFRGVEGRVARVAGQQRVIVTLSKIGLISTAYIPTAFLKKMEV